MEISSVSIVVALVLGITQAFKIAGLPKRFVPIVAVVLGGVIAGILAGFTSSIVITGVTAGLMAMGLWSGVKTTTK